MVRLLMVLNVHDAFVKAMFSRPEHAASLLRQILPPALVARIDFTTLLLCVGSYVDEVFKERYSDLLFSVTIDGRASLLYILFEHQSTVDDNMSFRLLRYEVRIWERWQADHPGVARLPVIVPVVLHHSATGWIGGTSFEEQLDADDATLAAVGPYVPRFRFILEDISHETDEALRSRVMTALARLGLWCLRHAREPEVLVEQLGAWMDLVREVRRAPDGVAAVVLIMRYILEVSAPAEPDVLVGRLAAATGDEAKEEIVTAADQLREQGRQQGSRDMLLDLLRERFGALPETANARVAGAELAQIREWNRRVLKALTLEDVFGR
jgi:predicted transposase/invertase (TIGR01784 family)